MIDFKDFCDCKLILESQDNVAVLAFGRMNPPSMGHYKMMEKMVKEAKKYKATAFLYLSHTQDKKKNPLDYDTKIDLVKKYAPKGLKVCKSPVKTFIDACKEVANMGAKKIVFVCGEDRTAEYDRLLNKYKDEIGVDEVEIVTLDRGDGISGTKLRELILKGDYDAFEKESLPKKDDAKKVYDIVREVLG